MIQTDISIAFLFSPTSSKDIIQSTGVLGHEVFKRVLTRILRKVPLLTYFKAGGQLLIVI